MFLVGALITLILVGVVIFLLYVHGIARIEGEPYLETLKAITKQIFIGEFF